MPNIIGWAGNLGFILGVLLLAKKRIFGFAWNILGNLLYALQGYLTGLHSLLSLSIILILINIYGILEWQKLEK